MTLWNIIPTCDNAMSQYTVIALSIVVAGGLIGFGSLIWWNLREFDSISDAIRGYDTYINDTTDIINKMQIEIAVQESSMETLKKDISEIKSDVKTLLKR
jgi:hypothetical protein